MSKRADSDLFPPLDGRAERSSNSPSSAELLRDRDWTRSPLGDPGRWPQPLKTLVELMLASKQAMFIVWGPERTLLYNDTYSEILASKHPAAFGTDFLNAWNEIRSDLLPIVDKAYAGEPVHMSDIQLMMTRRGFEEETHFSFSYTPVRDETGTIAGFFCACVEITEQVLADREQAAERDRLSRMFSQAPSFMAVLMGPDHIFDITNASYLQLIGHRDVLGKPVREALPEVDGQGFFELLDDVFNTGEAFVGNALPVFLQREPGATPEQRFVDFVYQPIRAADGTVTGIFAQGHDITDQKLAQMAASSSEARFRGLAQSLPNHVWTSLPNGHLNWFNDQVYLYSGAKPGSLDGLAWASIVHPDDVSAAAEGWQNALLAGSPYNIEFRLRRADGNYRWHLARANPVLAEDAKVSYWVGTNTDIQDQKTAELALKESAVRLELALAAAQMGVWECQIENGQFVNLQGDDVALHLLGGTPGEPSSFEQFAARVHPQDRPGLAPAAKRALDPNGEGTMDLEYRITLLESDQPRWVHARAKVLTTAAGTRMIGTVRDITESKAAEATQQVLGEELQHRIKNTLSMVTAIASQTLKGDDITDRRTAFNARIEALAQAHDLLISRTWQSAPILTVIERALAPHLSSADRFILDGINLDLTAKQALSISMTVHELATNAAKYGALSTATGQVQVKWGFENGPAGNQFIFRWTETGGPTVTEPTRKGFGTRLITRALAADFNGQVSIDYAPGGIVCVLASPANAIAAHDPLEGGAETTATHL